MGPDLFILPMGWGSGYDAKTVTDLLTDEVFEAVVETYRNTEGLGRPGNMPGNPWMGPDDSPKSRKVVIRADQTLEPVGWVVVQLNPVGDLPAEWTALEETVPAPGFEEEEDEEVDQEFPATVVDFLPATNDDAGTEASGGTEQQSQDTQNEEVPEPTSLHPLAHFVLSFMNLPEQGDCFKGTVLYRDDQTHHIYLEIPGLSADDLAMAWIHRDDLPTALANIDEDDLVDCQVAEVAPEPNVEGYWLVRCRIYIPGDSL